MKVRRIVVLFLFFFLVSFLSNVPAQVNAQTQVSKMRNIAITMIICSESYDAFADWIKPYSSFHNYTLIINRESDSNYSWFLENKTRVDFLTSLGEVIPSWYYIQIEQPEDRVRMLNTTINEWVTYLGYPPDGVFMYQPDTCSANFLKANGVNYVMGYCFDQYQVDWMSERGGWQLPYYANSKQSLMPENESAQGIVILPWLTWDWVDSFTLNHLFESETIGCAAENDTDYVISLSDATLASSEPFGYYAYSFEFGWLYAVGALDDAGAVLDYFISNQTYQKYSCGNFTHWFRNIYSITPTYHVNFSSPNSGDQVEWYYDAKSRIARHDGVVVSYVDYTDQLPDQYLTNAGNLDLSVSVSNINCIDNSLNFKIDALGGGQYRAPAMGNGSEYSEDLSKFPQYYSVPSSEPAHASGNLFTFNNVCLSSAVASVLVISVLSCVAWFKKRKRSLT